MISGEGPPRRWREAAVHDEEGVAMGVGSVQEPFKVGFLCDIVMPPHDSWDLLGDFFRSLDLAFDEALATELLDRPVEVVRRTVEGLPRGNAKVVLDAWDQLVADGCVLVIGPLISENAIPLREHIERGGFVPTISWCGSEDWLGEWTFALSDGNLTEEGYYLANLCAQAGLRRIGVSYERSLIGAEYLSNLRRACDQEGVEIVATAPIAQTAVAADGVVAALRAAAPDAIVHVGFGLGLIRINEALAAVGWDPPRYTTTAWENGFMSDEIFRAYEGWIGIEHYDEENPVGQAVLDRFEAAYGTRPEYPYSLYGYDMGQIVAHALAYAEPVAPTGVLHGLEKVKMLPSALGVAGTRISFGKWKRNGWHGAGYMVARSVAPDLKSTVLRGRLGPPVPR